MPMYLSVNHVSTSKLPSTPSLTFSNMPVTRLNGRVTLTHPKVCDKLDRESSTDYHAQGASAELLLYGATVISWKSGTTTEPQPIERLFVSSKAALDGSKPVRGGIPVIFPCFGAPTHPEHMQLGQHGFARSMVWTFDSIVMNNDAGVSVRLSKCNSTGITSFDIFSPSARANRGYHSKIQQTIPSCLCRYPY